jgi:hypothetical protein
VVDGRVVGFSSGRGAWMLRAVSPEGQIGGSLEFFLYFELVALATHSDDISTL